MNTTTGNSDLRLVQKMLFLNDTSFS